MEQAKGPLRLRFSAKTFALIALSSFAGLAHSDWVLNNQNSTLNFATTKAVDVGEIHSFEELSGRLRDNGEALLKIETASVDTSIPIRDERMQKMLFGSERYPQVVLSTEIPVKKLAGLEVGQMKALTLGGELGVRGVVADIASEVSVVKLADGSLQVNSQKPLLVNAKDVGLLKGIEKLREVAGLPSIGQSVLVTFQLNWVDEG